MGSGQLVIGGFYDNMICRGSNDPFLQVPPTGSMVNMTPSFYAVSVDGVMTDDELLEGHAPEKKRRLTSDQVHLLERSFKAENKLEPQRRSQLAKELGLEPRQVSIWFQNRRARWKTKQMEHDYDLLKTAYDSLISDYQGLIKEHEKLKSEVISFQEKLSANYTVDHKTCISSPDIISSLNLMCKEEDGLSFAGSTVADNDSLHSADCRNSGFLNYVSLEALQMVEDNAERTCSTNQWLCVDIGCLSYLTETAYAVEGEQFGCL